MKEGGVPMNDNLPPTPRQLPESEQIPPETRPDETPESEPVGKVRVRWHGIHPVFIVVPIVLVVTLSVLLIIYFTTETAEGTAVQWGYIDKAGEFVIPAQFLSALNFASNGLAAVETSDGWGYINRAGEIVIAAQYEGAATFSDSGYAAVKRNGSWGYIKKDGTLLVHTQVDEAYAFGDEGVEEDFVTVPYRDWL